MTSTPVPPPAVGSPWRRATVAAAWAATLALAGCATPAPQPPPPAAATLQQAGVPAQLPVADGALPETPALAWREVVQSARLAQWVEQALAHNRDLRVALLNVQRAQAQLGLADANRLPVVGVGLNATRAPNSQGEQANNLAAGLQLNAWEIDLFGRLASLSDAARAQWLASEAGRRAAEWSLVAAVVQAGLSLQADEELLALARQALISRDQTLQLTRLRESVGAASLLELQAQQTLAAQARATLAQLTRQQAQDRHALALLLGQPLPDNTASATPPPRLADEAWLAEVPAGLSSAVLLGRPDVIAAEQNLRAAQANIAAARAALWPTITLTAQAGQASPQLSGLFVGGNFAYTLAASAVATVFDAGRRQAQVAVAEVNQQVALAQYERSLQAAFRDTADALAGLATWRDQLAAQVAQRDAARETARLTELKASQGAASTLERLDAQRAWWAAEQAVVQVRLGELNNRVALFKALGR
jgi:outer membrane protein, multidrug efflux system